MPVTECYAQAGKRQANHMQVHPRRRPGAHPAETYVGQMVGGSEIERFHPTLREETQRTEYGKQTETDAKNGDRIGRDRTVGRC